MKKFLLFIALAAATLTMNAAVKAPILASRNAIPTFKPAKAGGFTNLSHKVIFDAPDGDAATYSADFTGFGLSFISFDYEFMYNSGWATDVVYCDNGDVYLRNVMACQTYPSNSYIKGKVDGDRIVFSNMQCIGGFNDDDEDWDEMSTYGAIGDDDEPDDEWTYGKSGVYFYLAVANCDPEAEAEYMFTKASGISEFAFIKDGDNLVLDLPENQALMICYESGEWGAYSLYTSTLSPFTAQAINELPAGLEPAQ